MHKTLFFLIFCISFIAASPLQYIQKADELNLSDKRYWQLLLHMNDGVSEIDDPRFFLSAEGKRDAKSELDATIMALYNESSFDDNATACRFPARVAWLQKELDLEELPVVDCKEYNIMFERLAPKSATLVFPSAHINSPASMFGHTFLRINSRYKSKLLAYAVNYAAEADPDKENATVFAIKGLFGGYYGKYSLLPYYEKLKEYRDAEQRDIWEYDLDLSEAEVVQMVRHIWELNGAYSSYYFFTQNCSYNMLWLMEIARPDIDLRGYFTFQVAPLESVFATESEGLVASKAYRASKRTKLLAYEKSITQKNIAYVKKLTNAEIQSDDFLQKRSVSIEQKRLVYEAAIEYLESSYSKNSMNKEEYLTLFYELTKARAGLRRGENIDISTPPNPLEGHRAIRLKSGYINREGDSLALLGVRPVYHDLADSSIGFLRGTQIEFLDFLLSYSSKQELAVEKATLLSIVSLAQRSEFYNSFSWRINLGWDRDSLDKDAHFNGSIGAGMSFGNEFGYSYIMLDPFFYLYDGVSAGVGGSLGFVLDKYSFMNTNIELTQRYYESGNNQLLVAFSQSFRLSQNLQLQLKYDYKQRAPQQLTTEEQSFGAFVNFYF